MIITSHFNSLPLICVKFYFSALAAIGNFCCLSKFNCLESLDSCTQMDSCTQIVTLLKNEKTSRILLEFHWIKRHFFPLEKSNSTGILGGIRRNFQ